MLRLSEGQVESLWDEVLPGEVRELPEDLAALDVLLRDPELLAPIASVWRREAVSQGRPTIPMELYVRLMVVKQRTGWGYETLVREVSDSLHLRRFCLIALGERVPHESTVRKLTRRLGGAVVDELTRCVIAKAQRETRFRAQGGEDRLDGRGGRRALPERRRVEPGRSEDAGARGTQAAGAGRRGRRAGAGSQPSTGAAHAGDLAHDGTAHRGAQGAGAGPDRAGRGVVVAFGARGQATGARSSRTGARPWRTARSCR